MPRYIYRLEVTRPDMLTVGPTPEEDRTLTAHFSFLTAQAEDGVVLLAGRTVTTGPETYGIVIFEAEDDVAARALMAADPAVVSGVMTGEVQPFRVAIGGDVKEG
ncbi:MAG: hypothetical protein GY838_03335 [bacterium]|nr:hypothetical protein [bacterium]